MGRPLPSQWTDKKELLSKRKPEEAKLMEEK
jgi:hypothetical protein